MIPIPFVCLLLREQVRHPKIVDVVVPSKPHWLNRRYSMLQTMVGLFAVIALTSPVWLYLLYRSNRKSVKPGKVKRRKHTVEVEAFVVQTTDRLLLITAPWETPTRSL